ncbi:MAG: rod shape-determining protein MreD [Candidatus Acidiferrales bacterium]
MMAAYSPIKSHIEVHKFRVVAVIAVTVAALLIQSFLPVRFPRARMLDLPLLITLYFGFSRRNPSTGLLLGMVIGLAQDSLGRSVIGLYGISKTLTGYLASSFGSRIDVEHPLSRFGLTVAFYIFHQGAYALTQRLLLAQPEAFFTTHLLIAAGVNAAVAVALFPLLDKLRLPS